MAIFSCPICECVSEANETNEKEKKMKKKQHSFITVLVHGDLGLCQDRQCWSTFVVRIHIGRFEIHFLDKNPTLNRTPPNTD